MDSFPDVVGAAGYTVFGGAMTTAACRGRSGCVSVYELTLGLGAWVVASGAPGAPLVVYLLLRGAVELHSDNHPLFLAPGYGAVTPPGATVSIRGMVASTGIIIRVKEQAFHGGVSVGGALPRTIDLGRGAGRALRESTLTSTGLPEVTGALVAALAEPPTRSHDSISRIVEAVGRDPRRDRTVAELAREHGLSARSLQRLFVHDVGLTPHVFLLNVRLGHAHRALYASSPGATTVSAVAREWGFRHLGRFAKQYRSAFGEAPSETLRR